MYAMMSTCWKLCVILAAVVGATKGWKIGSGHKYRLTNTLIFREVGSPKSESDVGFQLTGELDITAVWQDPNDANSFLLKFKVWLCLFNLNFSNFNARFITGVIIVHLYISQQNFMIACKIVLEVVLWLFYIYLMYGSFIYILYISYHFLPIDSQVNFILV